MVNNYFRPGPATAANVKTERFFVGASDKNGQGQWLIKGNKFETGNKFVDSSSSCWSDDVLVKVNADNWYGFTSNSTDRAVNMALGNNKESYKKYVLTSQNVSSGISLQTADEAYRSVVNSAGASLPRYDEVDRRLLDEAAGNTDPKFAGYSNGKISRGLGIINSPCDIKLSKPDKFQAGNVTVTCYPYLGMEKDESMMQDTDGDGIPDKYELEKGLNPNDSSDGCAITSSGYSNLELFLHGIADGSIDKADY